MKKMWLYIATEIKMHLFVLLAVIKNDSKGKDIKITTSISFILI